MRKKLKKKMSEVMIPLYMIMYSALVAHLKTDRMWKMGMKRLVEGGAEIGENIEDIDKDLDGDDVIVVYMAARQRRRKRQGGLL